jgi:chromosome segregation ATPase
MTTTSSDCESASSSDDGAGVEDEALQQRLAELERREKEVSDAELRFKQELEWTKTNHEVIMRELEEQATAFEHQVREVAEKSARLDGELRELACARREVDEERAQLARDRLQAEAERHLLRTQRTQLCDRFEAVLARVARAAAV